VPQNFYFQVEAPVEQLQWAHAFHELELHMVENVEPQEMEEKAYEEQHSPLGAHQVYEPHLGGHKEQMIVLSPYHFFYLLLGWPQPQSWFHA
jgi:hypothetical protein